MTTEDNNSRAPMIRIAVAVAIIAVVAAVAIFMVQKQRGDDEQSAKQELSEISESVEASSSAEAARPTTAEPTTTSAPQNGSQSDTATTDERSGPQGGGNFGKDPVEESTLQSMVDAANAFSVAFFETSFTSDEQVQSVLAPMSTTSMADKLKTVAFYNMPDDTVDTERTKVYSTGTSDALVDTYTANNKNLRVYLVKENDNWKVSDYGVRDSTN